MTGIRKRNPELGDRCLREAFTGLGWIEVGRVRAGLRISPTCSALLQEWL